MNFESEVADSILNMMLNLKDSGAERKDQNYLRINVKACPDCSASISTD
jgi:hypothetical protein